MDKYIKSFLLFFIFCFVSPLLQATSFATLAEAQKYAQAYPEYVTPDNKDWLRPIFSSFHTQGMPNVLQRTLMRMGLPTKVWNWQGFSKLLQTVITQQEKQGFQDDFSEQFRPNKGDKFIIWGDLNGAFHSLMRDLTYLQNKGIINDAYKISPPYYFVFNGNAIEGSPYILETLTVIFRLMQANPNRVIYTRGYHEAEERWHNFELMRELKTRLGQYTKPYTTVMQLLNRFFGLLPIALYLIRENDLDIDIVVISSNDSIVKYFDKKSLQKIVGMEKQRGYFYYQKTKENDPKKVHLRAFITGENRSVSYTVTDGLTLIGAVEGAMRWMVFSSPIERNQQLYKFYHDAFAQLNITNGMDSWTLALFNQKASEPTGFAQTALFNLVTGRNLTKKREGEPKEEIFFGATMDLSKGASPIGKRVKEGLQLAFNKELVHKTIPATIPRLATVNDEYTPRKTRAAVEDLIKKNITMLIGSQGSASLESYLDLIRDGKVLVMFPFTGSPLFRKPGLRNLIHYRGSYINEGKELVKYALKDLKSKKFAIFYQDDAFGRGALEGARRVLKQAGITNFLEIPHERNVVNYKTQAIRLREYEPDTILFSTNALAIRGLIRQMGVQYFAGKKLLGLSVYEDAFERFLKDKGLAFILIRMVPDPAISNLPIAKEYRKWADKYNLTYDKVSFEQFINAYILFEMLRKIDGPVTKEKIIAVAENMKNYPLQGLVINFNPETRELSDTLWIDPGKGEWIQRTTRDEKSLSTAEKSDQEKKLQFGSTIDLSGGARELGLAVKRGIELRLNEAYTNKVYEAPQITIVDDEYNPEITRKEVEAFLAKGIDVIVCPVGSPTLQSYLDLVKQGKIAVIFPTTGALLFRTPDLTNIVNLRVSYAAEGRVLTRYALEQMNAKKIILFYQNDAFGKGLLDAAHEVLQQKAVETLDVAYEREQTSFTEQVKRVHLFNPDTILFFSTSIAARDFIRQYGIRKALTLQMLGNSDIGETVFMNFVKDTGLKFIYVNVVPNPDNSQLPIVEQYRAESRKRGMVFNTFSLESYIGVDILLYVLRILVGEPTKEKIIETMQQFQNQEYKGLILNYDPENRTLLHVLWMNKGTSDWQMIKAS